jgi:phosphonate transport system substrate-binding protein
VHSNGIRKPLRVVTLLAPNLFPVYELITHAISQRLGWPAELVVGSTEADLDGSTDVCFLCGLLYIQKAHLLEPIAAPVIKGERYGGRPIYFSEIIVRADSPFQSFADLRGRSWAYNEPNSQSGYGIIRHHLLQLDETMGFFGSIVEAGWHERSIHLVRSGQVHASAIDSHVLAVAMRDDPDLAADLRIIGTLGPSTIQPVAVARRVSAAMKSELRHLLVELVDDSTVGDFLSKHFIDRFLPIGDSDYDDIREMCSAAKSAGFETIR